MRKLLPLVLVTLACSHSFEVQKHERFDKPDEAAAFYAMKHAAPPGVDPHERYATARVEMQSMPHYSTADVDPPPSTARARNAAVGGDATPWQFLGPGNIGGRTLSLIFDPSNDQIMYAAGISGGIWKSTNGGESWTPIGDALANLDVSSLVIDPHDPRSIFAGTGEGYYREDIRGTNVPLRGNGIFATHDAGQTWTQLAQTANNDDFHWVNDLIMSPRDSQRLYAATRSGVWRSRDGGGTWTRVLSTTVKGGCTDLIARPDTQSDTVFAACGVFEQATVYRNQNAQDDGSPWAPVLSDDGMSRTSLAIAPSNPSIIYALSASNKTGPNATTQNLQAVYRSASGGDAGTWTTQVSADDSDKLNRVLLTNPIAAVSPQCDNKSGTGDWVPMGWHCNVIAVDPTNPDRLWAAGVDMFRSDDGGKTWGVASYWWAGAQEGAWVHADQHVILFHSQFNGSSNQTMFVANDGGIFRTDNANASIVKGVNGACSVASSVRWRSLNRNYGVTQFYGGAVWPDGTRFIGGAQDNGTVVGSIAGGTDQWAMIWGGDGGFPLVDPTNPRIVYVQSQNANILRSSDGGDNFLFDTPPRAGSDAYLFVAPLVMDPSNHLRLWVGGDQMWRSIAPGVWTAASAAVNGKVSAIAVAPGRSDRVVAGTNTGAIIRSDNATTTTFSTQWTSTKPRDGFVSAIQFDPFSIDTVYATYSGFGGPHVWRSIDGGVTWSALDGNLPDIPVHSIAIDTTLNGRIYLGTDLGVFVSLSSGASWMVESGLTPVLTEYVTIAQGDHGPSIYAFTHGRGAWRASLTAPVPRRHAVGH
jgi:photosystem II stability/assembly factor-like uncharacterized protein